MTTKKNNVLAGLFWIFLIPVVFIILLVLGSPRAHSKPQSPCDAVYAVAKKECRAMLADEWFSGGSRESLEAQQQQDFPRCDTLSLHVYNVCTTGRE